jgi:iron complex outermembrane recepter protein
MNSRALKKAIKGGLLAGSALCCVTTSSFAFAQSAPVDEDEAPGVITVTARKATESLQDVPVTVTAVGRDTLENFGVNQVADVVSRVPTLNVQVGGSGSGGSISLRGVGSSSISAAFDSAVAFDYDGVVISTMRLVQAGFFDVQQIDVLKGPQSLYFGKSASAGVFSLRSAEPTQKWEVGGKASYEFEEQGYVVGGYISGPLTDTLGIRVAAQYNDVKKYNQIQPGVPTINPNRGLKDFVGRVTLAWEPTDTFKANLKLNYVTNRNDGAISFQDVNCGPNGRADEVVVLGAIAIPSGANCNNKDKFFAVSDPSSTQTTRFPDGSAGQGRYPGRPFGETDIFFGRFKWDAELTDTVTLTSVSGVLLLKSIDFDSFSSVGQGPAFSLIPGVPVAAIAPRLAAVNTPGSPQGVGSSDPLNRTDQFSQELRVATDFDGKFNFTLGAFYESRNIDFNTSQQAVNISLIALDPVTGNSYDYYKQHKTRTDAYSFFGSGTFDITEKLELAGGVRWTKEKKINTITVPYVHAILAAGPAFIDSGFFSGPIQFRDTNVSPEVSLRYKATDDINVYAAYKTGFKSGGIDNSALPSSNLLGFNDPALRDSVANGLIFKSETAKGGEAGIKAQFDDRSITINASAFYYVFKNLQLQVFNATTIQFVTFNASEQTVKGLDVDFAWRTPVNGLSFSGSAAYTNAKFTKDLISSITGENLKGRRASRAPEFAGNAAFDWALPLASGIQFGINGNAQYSSSYFTANTSRNDLKQKSYITFDGSISISDPDKKWKLALVGVNLADKIYSLTSGGRPFLAGPGLGIPVGDDLNVNYNRGRQVFVEASFKF